MNPFKNIIKVIDLPYRKSHISTYRNIVLLNFGELIGLLNPTHEILTPGPN